jgi:hypothetical protein
VWPQARRGAETAFAAPPEGEIVSEEVAYEQAMDESGQPIGPKVKVKKEKHLPDAAALSVAAEKPGRGKARGKASARSLQASGCKTVWATRIGRSALGFVTYKVTAPSRGGDCFSPANRHLPGDILTA